MLVDLQKAFREASAGGCVGWELMDDHVHPSLLGQALGWNFVDADRELEARSGVVSGRVITVLIISLLGAMAALGVAWVIIYFGS